MTLPGDRRGKCQRHKTVSAKSQIASARHYPDCQRRWKLKGVVGGAGQLLNGEGPQVAPNLLRNSLGPKRGFPEGLQVATPIRPYHDIPRRSVWVVPLHNNSTGPGSSLILNHSSTVPDVDNISGDRWALSHQATERMLSCVLVRGICRLFFPSGRLVGCVSHPIRCPSIPAFARAAHI
jgi:hypothetical protein